MAPVVVVETMAPVVVVETMAPAVVVRILPWVEVSVTVYAYVHI